MPTVHALLIQHHTHQDLHGMLRLTMLFQTNHETKGNPKKGDVQFSAQRVVGLIRCHPTKLFPRLPG